MSNRMAQMEEAVKRLKALNVHPNVIKEFSRNDFSDPLLNYSDGGILFWIEDNKWKERISNFEKKYNAVVYHAIFTRTTMGDMLSLLYVCDEEEEWEMDWSDLACGHAVAYVINLADEFCSEIGGIGIERRFGGLIRTY